MKKYLLMICGLMVFATMSVSTLAATTTKDGTWGPSVIYGDDNRLDLYQSTNSMHLELADSTLALIKASNLLDNGNGTTQVMGAIFGEDLGLCSTEPFREQNTAAFCSGFLVSEDVVVTAGHCIETQNDCSSTKFVFGFSLPQKANTRDVVSTADVYNCKNIIHTERADDGKDFAVIKLDRSVMNRRPLKMRQNGAIKVGDPLVVIGHPEGLPTKIASGATVRSLSNGFFVANLDTYGGNSGSAVFSDDSGEVEGILVRGENDFVFRNGCTMSNICPPTGCRGEDSTSIEAVLPYIHQSI